MAYLSPTLPSVCYNTTKSWWALPVRYQSRGCCRQLVHHLSDLMKIPLLAGTSSVKNLQSKTKCGHSKQCFFSLALNQCCESSGKTFTQPPCIDVEVLETVSKIILRLRKTDLMLLGSCALWSSRACKHFQAKSGLFMPTNRISSQSQLQRKGYEGHLSADESGRRGTPCGAKNQSGHVQSGL